jgi:hypothetical protein
MGDGHKVLMGILKTDEFFVHMREPTGDPCHSFSLDAKGAPQPKAFVRWSVSGLDFRHQEPNQAAPEQ